MNFLLFAFFSLQTVKDDIDLYANTEFAPNLHLPGVYHKKSMRKLLDDKQYKLYDEPAIKDIQKDIKERTPFKVFYDLEQILEGNDPNQCKFVGQEVNWSQNIDYTCKEQDIFTDVKKKVLNETLDNVRKYVERIMSVRHKLLKLKPYIKDDLSYFPPETMDVDHYVKFWVRPFKSTIIAGSFITNCDSENYRPTQSQIVLAARFIPTVTQNYDTVPRSFFNVMFHELMHSIGMINVFIPYWINQKTGYRMRPTETIKIYNDTYGKKHMMVCTPYAKKVAQKYLKRTKTDDGRELCLEFEDLGGQGTEYTHPKATIYRQDAMVGVNPLDGVISPVMCSLIADIGYYSVNWSMCEKITWLTDNILTKDEIHNMGSKPTYKTFPKRYIYEPNSSFVSHDLRGYTPYMRILPYNVTKDRFDIIKYDNLYIPPDGIIGTTKAYDFALLKNPKVPCQKNQWAMHYINDTGLQAFCTNSSLKNSIFTFLDLEDNEHQCKNGENVAANGIVYICPDLNLIQKVMNYLGPDMQGYESIDFSEVNVKLILLIVTPICAAIVLISIITTTVLCIRKLRNNREKSPTVLTTHIV